MYAYFGGSGGLRFYRRLAVRGRDREGVGIGMEVGVGGRAAVCECCVGILFCSQKILR